ncbi:MAG: serine--tRNA ligase [Campylobacter sp.]|uniref:serine--tRNA ligase n=1 Tax=Campylobacter sp. TaxID=205 RepID=UPI002971E319|nr:serine--tRNA ligase [Campylobacter sp.]MCI7076318.1 serine--tRNA ligase [Campylobacter sp.]MDD7600923.1 serine--tRNA ligase [Campylobacteraceae bacterium]MDY5886864.1 serine--tRNA ligase [Campylobacter sp.]
MINLKLIETNFDEFNSKLKAKKVGEDVLKNLLEAYKENKKIKLEFESLQSEQNAKSKKMGEFMKSGDKEKANALKTELDSKKAQIATLNESLNESEEKLNLVAAAVPNIIDDDVPLGANEDENVELKKVLEPPRFDFKPLEHWQLAEKNGWIDFATGAKLSGSRFCVLRGQGAKLARALVNYMIDFNSSRGFELVNVPFLVSSNTLFGTGQLPKFADDLYKIDDEDLYLIPTSEVPVTNLYNDEIIAENELPIKMTCYSACFRKEAGSAGKDTRGMIRQHQFEKVELVCITKPEQSDKVFDEMVACASDLLSSLGLAHRHMLLCSGDLGFSAAKTIDLEVWLAGQDKYREISSVSNTRDFQARRAKIRFKDGKKNTLCHTLNGSSLAVGRTLIAIMENYQQKDGSIKIPAVLEKYM